MTQIQTLERKIESLAAKGEETPAVVDLLLKFAREIVPDDSKRALEISVRALDLAERISYEKGVAHGKIECAYRDLECAFGVVRPLISRKLDHDSIVT